MEIEAHPEAHQVEQPVAQPEAQPEEPEAQPEEPEPYDDKLPIMTYYGIGKEAHKKYQDFIEHILIKGAIIFGGSIIYNIKKSYHSNSYYEYCMKNNIDYKSNFNNRRCHPESILRMSTPFQNNGDIDMYIQEADLEKLMNYFNSEYNITEQSAVCSYFIPEETRVKLIFKRLILKQKISETVSSSLNIFGCAIKHALFPHIYIDLIIIKNNSHERPPFNTPDFICNQLFMYWSSVEKRIIISVNNIQIPSRLSFIDNQKTVSDTLEVIKQQCINNIAELYPEVIPPLHRVLKMLLKGYTIKIPKETIPGGSGNHKFAIPEDKKTEHKCLICYDEFKQDTTITYPCNKCSTAYHINCYVAFHIDTLTTHNKQPNCPCCKNILTKDNCAFVNMVNLINNYNEYVKTRSTNNLTNLRFKYCSDCKTASSPTNKLPHKINCRTFTIKYK